MKKYEPQNGVPNSGERYARSTFDVKQKAGQTFAFQRNQYVAEKKVPQ
jgi:hypothetical protein